MDKSSFAKENLEKLVNRATEEKKIDIASLLQHPEVKDLINGFMAAKGATQTAKNVVSKPVSYDDNQR